MAAVTFTSNSDAIQNERVLWDTNHAATEEDKELAWQRNAGIFGIRLRIISNIIHAVMRAVLMASVLQIYSDCYRKSRKLIKCNLMLLFAVVLRLRNILQVCKAFRTTH